MDINSLIKDIHNNAKAHGWWESDRPFEETVALIHSEWSEALEEARAGRGMVWYGENGKPEGIAFEIADGIIRCFDYLGRFASDKGVEPYPDGISIQELIEDAPDSDFMEDISISEIVSILHWSTSKLFETATDNYTETASKVMAVVVFACRWLDDQDINVETLILEKHRYNKQRPYKHRKKF